MASVPPGWNDPPPVPANESAKSKLSLNKRVAYPLSKDTPNDANKSVAPPINLMPLPTSQPPPKAASDSTEININKDILTKVLDKINKVIEDKKFDSKRVEILKRLKTMENMWEMGSLNTQVHEKVLELTECIENNDISKANDLHIYLTVNYAVLCSSWVIGFKYILHHCK